MLVGNSGGIGLGRLEAALIMEAMAHGCPSTSAFISIHNMAAWMIDRFGGAAVKAKYLPSLVTMDMIASYLPVKNTFAIATLAVAADKTATFTLCDDLPPNVVHASQDVPYTNFPLDEIKLYVQYDGERWIILLPSEY